MGDFLISKNYENNLEIDIKKEQGIYYTPYVVVDYILNQVLKDYDIIKNPKLKILDLSCGCGNFLLVAYDILYQKFYESIDELKRVYGDEFINEYNLHRYIIKNCLYGIDTDREALEILKNQLRKKSKFNSKVEIVEDSDFNLFEGDSLKDDCKWCKKGIFNYIVGNPPYIGQKLLDNNYKKFLYKTYSDVYKDKGDLYFCFYKRAMDLLCDNGVCGFITPRYFMQSVSGENLREYLLKNSNIDIIVDFLGANIFNHIGIASCICIFTKSVYDNKNKSTEYIDFYRIIDEKINIKDICNMSQYISGANFEKIKVRTSYLDNSWIMADENDLKFYRNIEQKSDYYLGEICTSFQGIITGCDKAFVVKNDDCRLENIDKSILKQWIKNKDIDKYIIKNSSYKLIYSNDITDENEHEYTDIIDNFIVPYKQKLSKRRECVKNIRKWYELQWGREKKLFEQKKIMYPYKSKENKFAIDFSNSYASADVYSFYIKDEYKDVFSYEYLVGILNSKVYEKYFKMFAKCLGKNTFDYYPNKVMKLKIFKDYNYKKIENISKEIIKLTEKIQDKNISLTKEKDCLERKIDFLENKIEEEIKQSLDLSTDFEF